MTSNTAKRPPGSARETPRGDCVLVARQIDDAVRDDDVDRVVGRRNRFDGAFEELDVGRAGLLLILATSASISSVNVEAVRRTFWKY
jgi:hypothetical protein